MLFMYGYDTLKLGLKNYFAKHSFKNTELKDFVQELAFAAKETGAVKDEKEMIAWSETWLKTPGCADIKLEFETDSGKITKACVHQQPYNS